MGGESGDGGGGGQALLDSTKYKDNTHHMNIMAFPSLI